MHTKAPWPMASMPLRSTVAVETTARSFAEALLGQSPTWDSTVHSVIPDELRTAAFGDEPTERAAIVSGIRSLTHIVVVDEAPRSHMDAVIELLEDGVNVASGTVLVANRGTGFHGHHGRPWATLPGNLHLVAYFRPDIPLDRPSVALTALPATVVLNAADRLPGLAGKAGLRWMNDVVIEGTKVAGVLCFTQLQGQQLVGLVVGIGVNVESTPRVEPTPFVPRVAALREFSDSVTLRETFAQVCLGLDEAVACLIDGKTDRLVEMYRRRSTVVGKNVEVWPDVTGSVRDEDVVRGRIATIGASLELVLEPGSREVTSGRLRVLDDR